MKLIIMGSLRWLLVLYILSFQYEEERSTYHFTHVFNLYLRIKTFSAKEVIVHVGFCLSVYSANGFPIFGVL